MRNAKTRKRENANAKSRRQMGWRGGDEKSAEVDAPDGETARLKRGDEKREVQARLLVADFLA